MAFFGTRFIFQIFSALIAFCITAILFLFCYNFVLDEKHTTRGALIGCLVVATAVGGGIGYWSYKFSKRWAIPLIAAACGIVTGLTLVKLAKVRSTPVKIVGALLGAALFFYLGQILRRFVKSAGTALIGSFFFVRGIGTYAGGYPSETDFIDSAKEGNVQVTNSIALYFGGMVVMTIGTTLFQLWYFRDEDDSKSDHEDAFENEDENRRCGCF